MIRSPVLALIVLTVINLFNYIDRYVVPAIQPRIKDALGLTDFQLGLLSSSFVVVFALTSPVFGRLGDTRKRTGLVGFGVAVWSLATAGAGLAQTFGQIFVARAFVGVGEAAYGTIAPALLADFFPERQRGRVFAIFYAAIPIGSALGYVLGGAVEARFGWRAAFFVAGLPGLVLATLIYLIAEPERGASDDAAHGHATLPPGDMLAACKELAKNRAYTLTVAGYTAYTFALGGLAIWMPTFLERIRKIPLAEANDNFGKITVISGFIGTLGGGWLADGLVAGGRKQGFLLLSGVAACIAIPFAFGAVWAEDTRVIYGSIFMAELMLFASTGPINTMVVNVVPTHMRATAVAVSITAIHVLGDAISPSIIGFTSDVAGLEVAVLIVPLVVAVTGAIWTYAAVVLERAGAAPQP